MIKIDLLNVQAIADGHIELEENSIIEFVGDNSNGKSILSKVIDALTKGDLKDRETRKSLINDNADQAVILMTKGKEQLGLLLREEVKDSIIMYVPNIDEMDKKIVRVLNDTEGCDALIKRFGFRTYSKGDICLQLSPTFGPIPFVTTGGAVNWEIVQDITTDKVADEFLKTFSTITYPVFKDRIKNLKRDRDATQSILDNMENYDWRAYEAFVEKARPIYLALQSFEPIEIRKIPIPNYSLIPYEPITVRKLPVLRFYEYPPVIGKLERTLGDYVSILNGVCPTCGKRLLDKQ